MPTRPWTASTRCFSATPNDVTALKQIAFLDRNIGKNDEAKEYERKVIALSPNDSEAYYTIGVVDWAAAYKNANTVLAREGLTDKSDGNFKLSKSNCAALTTVNQPLVTEGLELRSRRPSQSTPTTKPP